MSVLHLEDEAILTTQSMHTKNRGTTFESEKYRSGAAKISIGPSQRPNRRVDTHTRETAFVRAASLRAGHWGPRVLPCGLTRRLTSTAQRRVIVNVREAPRLPWSSVVEVATPGATHDA